ncbi:MAG: protein kinase family protein, partial [Chlamydiae bacterium]|nr:protein kinase family protein [Chlamydiota bacterium]
MSICSPIKMFDSCSLSYSLYKEQNQRSLLSSSLKIKIIKKIGKGSFGEVFQVRIQESCLQRNMKSALKVSRISTSPQSCHKHISSLKKEAQILRKLNEADPLDLMPIVRLIRAGDISFRQFGILECLYPSNLSEYIQKERPLGSSFEETALVAYQIFQGLSFLSQIGNSIIHGDIKPENILVEFNL